MTVHLVSPFADPAPAPDSPVFRPLRIRNLTLPNRIAMAPMTRELCPNGVPGPEVAAYYARRAAGGVGLIITEATDVDHPASWGGRPGVPRFFGADALAGWRDIVEAVHDSGGRIAPQLWHIGHERAVSGTLDPGTLLSPSGLSTTGEPAGKSMDEQDVRDVVDSFARAAAEARRLGFDAVEVSGSHGFLIDQFFWAFTNRRADDYGGTLERRTQFGAEVVAAVRAALGPEIPIILRISQWKVADFSARLVESPQELERFLAPLVEAGVDVFHCSTRRFWLPEFEGSDLNLAGWVKKLSGAHAMTVGSVGLDGADFWTALTEGAQAENAGLALLERMLEQEEIDLAAVGRALLADPRWLEKLRAGDGADPVTFHRDILPTLH